MNLCIFTVPRTFVQHFCINFYVLEPNTDPQFSAALQTVCGLFLLSPSLSLSVSFSVFLFFILPFKLCKIIFNCHAYQRDGQSEQTSSLSHASHRGLPLIVSNLAASVSHLTPVHFSRRASNCLHSYSNSNFESDIKVVASLRHPHPRLS